MTESYVRGDPARNCYLIFTNADIALQVGNHAPRPVIPSGFSPPLSLLPEHARIGDRPNLLSYCKLYFFTIYL